MLGAIIGGALGLIGSSSAAKAQSKAADASTALQRDIYNQNVERLAPYGEGNTNALAAYLYELGLGPAPMMGASNPYSIEEFQAKSQTPTGYMHKTDEADTPVYGNVTRYRVGGQEFDTRDAAQAWIDQQPVQGGTPYGGITLSPAAQFAMTQGRDTIEAGAAGRGGLYSGSTAKGLEDFRFGLSAQDRDNQLNRLLGLTQMGANAAAGQGAQGTAFAQSAGNNILQAGNAKSAGIIGGVNSVNDAIGNWYGYQQMNKLLDLQR